CDVGCARDVFFTVFFFSSRRRHTSSLRDWSSDVCSSDLPYFRRFGFACGNKAAAQSCFTGLEEAVERAAAPTLGRFALLAGARKIGRASCRERGEGWGGDGRSGKKERRRDQEQSLLQ